MLLSQHPLRRSRLVELVVELDQVLVVLRLPQLVIQSVILAEIGRCTDISVIARLRSLPEGNFVWR